MKNPAIILVMETSTPIIEIGLWSATEKKIMSTQKGIAPYDAGTYFFSMLDTILKKENLSIEDIDLIAATIGPGSFTALRTGLSLARGLSLSKQIPTLGVTSFQALFASVPKTHSLIRIFVDSLRKEAYTIVMKPDGSIYESPQMCIIDNLPEEKNTIWVGNIDHPKIQKIEFSLEYILAFALKHRPSLPSTLNPFYLNGPDITCVKKN